MTEAVTVEHYHAEGHTDTPSDTGLGGAAAAPQSEAHRFGAYDAASDFGPEGGPSVPFREYRAEAPPQPEPAPEPQTSESGPYAYNADGTPKFNKDGTRQKKRGRQAGSSNGARKAPPLRVAGIEQILLSTHGMLAALTQFEDFALEEREAKDLAGGIAAVAEHYPMLNVSEKDKAWMALMAIAASVYGPRAFLAFKQAQKARAERAQNAKRSPAPAPKPVVVDRPVVSRSTPGVGFPAFSPDS